LEENGQELVLIFLEENGTMEEDGDSGGKRYVIFEGKWLRPLSFGQTLPGDHLTYYRLQHRVRCIDGGGVLKNNRKSLPSFGGAMTTTTTTMSAIVEKWRNARAV